MPGLLIRGILLAAAIAIAPACIPAQGQEVVDRIVARVENDVILLSDIRALSRYQQFLDGKSETDAQILDRLIDQRIVRTEADVSRSPSPSEADIDRGLSRVRDSFGSDQEYEARRKQVGLSEQDVRALVASQLYLSNYLDSRFRPAVQINPKQIEDFYQTAVVPRAKARGQEPPALDAARDSIQEALIQNGINQQADQWLKESRLRLHVEKFLDEVAK
jgi:parvulin-like peptidyl-prolyl isomerase